MSFLVLTQDHTDWFAYRCIHPCNKKLRQVNQPKIARNFIVFNFETLFNLLKTVLSQQKYLAFWTNINQCLCIYEGQVYTAHK